MRLAIPRLLPILALAIVALLAAAATAAVVLRADVETLARHSDRAVEGVVHESRVVYDRPAGRIWTRHRVVVSNTLVGQASKELLVHVPGGRVGDIEQSVPGSARLAAGERVVLFLWQDAGRRLRVLGQAQGCFLVKLDAETGESIATNEIAGLTLLDTGMQPVKARRTRLRMDDLRKRVRTARRALAEEARLREEALDRRLEALRKRAERNEERTRGRPGGAQ